MADSLFASLLHSLDKSNISQIASSLGEPEQNVAKGMETSMASVMGSVASKAEDPGALRRMLDLVPETAGDVTWGKLASGLSTAGSPWMNTGKQILSGIFGSGAGAVAGILGRESGVGTSTATTMLMMACPMVLRFLSNKVRTEGWSMRGLGNILQKESGTIRNALPAGLGDLLWQRETPAAAASPVIAQAVQRERSSAGWLGALALAAAALACLWLWTHARRPVERVGVPTGEANRMVEEPRMGDYTRPRPPNLNLPANGPEARLLAIINGSNGVDASTRLDFDRLLFNTGSAKLRTDATAQIDNIASILKAYPNVTLNLAGFTDNVGNAQSNLNLSRERAAAVKSALVSRGIAADRLTTQAFGEDNAFADNSTVDGRAHNRRVTIQVAHR